MHTRARMHARTALISDLHLRRTLCILGYINEPADDAYLMHASRHGCVRVCVRAMNVCVCIALLMCASVCVVNVCVFVRARVCVRARVRVCRCTRAFVSARAWARAFPADCTFARQGSTCV
jgi:hypothetical protein